MLDIKSNVKPKTGSDKAFGIVFACFFVAIALYPLVSSQGVRLWALAVAAVFMVLAFLSPSLLTPLNKAWMRLGLIIGLVVSPIIMSVMFYLVITPIGLLMRLLGHDLLRLKPNPDTASYWIVRNREQDPMQSMRNQF